MKEIKETKETRDIKEIKEIDEIQVWLKRSGVFSLDKSSARDSFQGGYSEYTRCWYLVHEPERILKL